MSNHDYSSYYDNQYAVPQASQAAPVGDPQSLVTKLLQNGLAESVEALVRKQLEQMGAVGPSPPAVSTSSRPVPGTEQLEPYDPDAPLTNIERWILRFEELGERYGWSDLEKMYLLKQKLAGRARDWYLRTDDAYPHFNWENWKKELWHAFMAQIDFGADLEELVLRRKRSNESFGQYFQDKVALCERCGLGGEKAVSVIIRGLPDEYRGQAMALGCCAPEAFRAQFVEVADRGLREVEAERKGRFSPPRDRYAEVNWKKEEPARVSPKKKCYKCGQTGHVRTDCIGRTRSRQRSNAKRGRDNMRRDSRLVK